MNRFAFISNDIVKKLVLAFLVCWFFGFGTLAFIIFLVTASLFALFRRKKRDANDLRLAEGALLMAPVNGKFCGYEDLGDTKRLKFKIGLFNCYGFFMPTNGEILNYKESVEASNSIFKPYKSEVEMVDKNSNHYKFLFHCFNISFRPKVLVRSGDKGKIGGLIGFFPFGGKVFLEIPSVCDVVLNEKDRMISSYTVVAKVKEL